jgi:cyclopropane-fatty-acyl-phospholipid synthase
MSHQNPFSVTSAAVTPPVESTSFFQGAVLSAFADMKLGRLRLELPDGAVHEFGETGVALQRIAPGVSNTAFIQVRRPAFFTKSALYGDIGFTESYIDGDW